MRPKSLSRLCRENPGKWVFSFALSSPKPMKEGFAAIREGALGSLTEDEAHELWDSVRTVIEKAAKRRLSAEAPRPGEVTVAK